jgi:hypothetical protein
MNLLSLLTNHTHYWGVPHAPPAGWRLIQTCYECGRERELKVELRPSRISIDPQTVVATATHTATSPPTAAASSVLRL